MQFALGLVVLIGCTYIGYGLSLYYVKRHNFMLDLLQFASQLKVEIGFFEANLAQIVTKHKNSYDKAFRGLLQAYLRLLNKSEYITVSQLKKNLPLHLLEPAEQKQVLQFFSFLGKSDAQNQIEVIQTNIISFQGFLKKAQEEKNKYSGLFKKMGVLVGVFIIIIII